MWQKEEEAQLSDGAGESEGVSGERETDRNDIGSERRAEETVIGITCS